MLHEAVADTPLSRRRALKLKRILAAGTKMVRDGGFDALSINRLAKLLDYTPGALYRYFPSKDALVATIARRLIRDLDGELRDVADRVRDEPALVRALAQTELYRRIAEDAPKRFRLLATLVGEPRHVITDPAEARAVFEATLSALVPLVEALDAAASEGLLEPGDPTPRALILFVTLHGTLVMRKQKRVAAHLHLDALADGGLTTLLRGWGATPAAIDAARHRLRELAPPEVAAGAPPS